MRGTVRAGAGLGLRAFRHRNYRLFFTGQAVSLVGTWMQQVAQAWLVLELTHDPLWLGVITAAQFLPVLFFGLFAGVVADALPKRRTLIAAQLAMMVFALLLWALVVTGTVEVWMILLLAVVLGIANAVEMPVRQSYAIEMVGRDDLLNAVALNSALFNATRIVGPAIAGLLIAVTDIGMAFLVNGLSFMAVIVGLLLMRDADMHGPRTSVQRPTSFEGVLASLREGIAYVRATPIVLATIVTVGVVSTVGMNFQVLTPAYARSTLGVGADGFGFLMAAGGIGSLLSALWLAFGRTARPMLLGVGAVVLGLPLIVMGIWTEYLPAIVLQAVAGAGAIAMAATANATIQMNVPDALRGRVSAVYTTVFVGSTPFGGLLVGWIASTAGAATAMLLSGVAASIAGVVVVLWYRAWRQRAVAVTAPVDVPGGAMAPLRRR